MYFVYFVIVKYIYGYDDRSPGPVQSFLFLIDSTKEKSSILIGCETGTGFQERNSNSPIVITLGPEIQVFLEERDRFRVGRLSGGRHLESQPQ